MKKTNTTKQQNNKTTSCDVVLIQEQEIVFNNLKSKFNNLQTSNKDILINAVLMYRLGYTKESLFERVKHEYKGTDNWTAIRVNATRNFTGAYGLLKYAKEKGVDIAKWKDSFIVDSFIKKESLTINALYKKGQTPTIKESESDSDKFNNSLLKLIESFSKKLSKKEIFIIIQDACCDIYQNMKKDEQMEVDEELEKSA